MRIHYFQHVWFEDLGIIQDWAQKNNYQITRTAFFENEPLPDLDDIDWLIIMGGPMNIYEEDHYPWLKEEKEFIQKAIAQNKIVIGICLGAQLIADVLGVKIFQNRFAEIGWFPIQKTSNEAPSIFQDLPEEIPVFHWHQDTFPIPQDAIRLFKSEGCANQAFAYNGGKVLAFQCHLEMNAAGIKRILDQCGQGLRPDKYIQQPSEILQKNTFLEETNNIFLNLLNKLTE